MKPALFLAVALLALSGCGAPLCQDSAAEQRFVNGCTASGHTSYSLCSCAFDYLADRYSCSDFGSASVNVIRDACLSCGGGSGC